LATPNGTVNLKEGILRISYPEEKITKITSCSPKKMSIIKWYRFLLEVTYKNKEYIRYLQRLSGYCLTGNTTEHSLFFFYGTGGNGKGVFLNTITSILGDYAITAPLGMFVENKFEGHPTEIAMLRGARLVTAQEIQEGKAWNEVKIKALSGGDPLSARFVNKDFFTFVPNFKLLIAGNHEPQLRNVDEATTRRFNKLPFTNIPKKINKNLIEELKLEHPGILQWMINGCLSWQKIGLNPPKIVQETTKEYFSDQDTFLDCIEESCERGNNFQTTGEKLFSFWCNYAAKRHLRQGTDKTFKEQMTKYGFKYNKNISLKDENGKVIRNEKGIIKYIRGYEGIQIKTVIVNPISLSSGPKPSIGARHL
jgi:putative DNA primase/helicase